jgi:glycosyltransferase involved in cell wall biosynthesis
MPEFHTRYRALYSGTLVKRDITRASHIISVSECTKKDVIELFSISPENITVIPEAAGKTFQPCSEYEITRIKEKYSLNTPFILFVGTIEPRKNIPTLLRAFRELTKHYPGYTLVIAGQNGWKYQETYSVFHQLNLEKCVRFLTYVPHEDLPALYCASVLFVLPSWYEGFGLPPLEAMQCGVPVIVSDRGSLPEIVGSGGCTVPPDDPHTLMESMEKFLFDKTARQKQIQYNINRAGTFSWEKCAQETARVYQMVLGQYP